SLLGGLAVNSVATAAANRLLRERAGPLVQPVAGTQETYRWRGFDVEYTVAGEGPDLLVLHGLHAAATAQEFDRVIERLAGEYRVVAPDLPGFGRSDRPPVEYSAALYEAFVAEFAADVTEDAVCIASSLSGAYAAAAAEEAGFSQLVLVCPTADTGPGSPALRTLLRAPLVGEALFNLLVSRPSLLYFDRREAYVGGPDDATLDYQYRTAHQPGARFAPAAFIGGDLDPDTDLGGAIAGLDIPVTLVWGREADRPPLAVGRALAERADARLVVVEGARLLPHAEHPDAFLDGLELRK
ncbi:MAG: alpha/beta fold hydrolase, partial [Halobacteriaceae archaeon]